VRGIFRKALSDIRSHPMQVGLLFIVITASAMTLSLALNVQGSSLRPYDRLREESDGADLWISQIPEDYHEEDLLALSTVEAISGPFEISWENYSIRAGEKKQQLALIGMPVQPPEFDRPVLVDGRWLSEAGASEIVVDSGAAKVLGLEVGQDVTLLTPDGPQAFTVVGFVATAGRLPAPFNDPGFSFVLPETLERIAGEPATRANPDGYWYRAGLRLTAPNATQAFFAELREVSFSGNLQTWQNVRSDMTEINQFDVIFLTAFGFFALLAAGLIIGNTVGGQVLFQLRDIGILKAIGFTPRQVMLSLLAQNLVVGLVASIVGVLLGLLIAPFFLNRSASLLGVPAAASFNPALLAIAVVVALAVVALCTLLPAWRAGRITAVRALTSGNDARPGVSRTGAIAARLRLPTVVVVGIKDMWRRPVRTFLTMLALGLAIVTATFSASIESTFQRIMSDPTIIGGPPFDIIADRDLADDAEVRQILDSHPEVESYVAIYWLDGRVDNLGIEIMGADGNLNDPHWAVREGRMPEQRGEAAISTSLANDAGLGLGDSVSVLMNDGTPIDLTVVGRYADLEGRVVAMTHESLPPGSELSDYAIKTVEGTNNRALADALIAESGGNLDPEVLDQTIADIRNEWRPVIYALDGVLLFIAGVNLLASLLLSIRERHRDFAILKTVGFTPGQIGQAVFAGSAALTILAVLIGLPLGLIASRVMLDVLASAADIKTGISAMPQLLWLAPLLLAALAVTVVATVIPARRAATVEVAEALRYE